MRELRATYLFDPESIAAGWTIQRITAGYERDLLIFCREHPWPARGTDRPQPSRHRIDHWRQGEVTSIVLPETDQLVLHAQRLPADQWLAVRPRAKSEQDANAGLYDSSGQLVSGFHAGDGIEDIQATEDGQIWISYFDEGVFGNLSLGSAGLVCFDGQGNVLFQYSDLQRPDGLRPIADCYALNVATREDTWFYYYVEFPLVHLTDYQLSRYWTDLPIRGSKAFAICGDSALFSGGYGQNDRFFLLSLITGTVDEVQVMDERGNRVAPRMTYHTGVDQAGRPYTRADMAYHACFGRGERLYIQADQALYEVDLSQIPCAEEPSHAE
jgi:hypothetical protein